MVNNYQVLKEEEIEITIESVLFNKIHVQPNHLTNFILLVCKNLIYSCKCRKVTPNVNMLEKCVEDARKCEYYNARNNSHNSPYYQKWYGIYKDNQLLHDRKT